MTKENPNVIYNVSHAKLAPLTRFTFNKLGAQLSDAQFDGVSALPYRLQDIVGRYECYFPEVKIVEEWNPGNYDNIVLATMQGAWGHVRRAAGDKSEPPILQDTIFFPSRITSETIISRLLELNPAAFFVAAHLEDVSQGRFPGRTHVHDQSDFRPHVMTLDEVVARAQDNDIKLWHDPKRPIESAAISYPNAPVVRMRQGVDEIPRLSGMLAGVDLPSESKTEIAELLAGRGILADTVRAAREAGAGSIRVEVIAPLSTYLPTLGLVPSGSKYLGDIVAAIKQLD